MSYSRSKGCCPVVPMTATSMLIVLKRRSCVFRLTHRCAVSFVSWQFDPPAPLSISDVGLRRRCDVCCRRCHLSCPAHYRLATTPLLPRIQRHVLASATAAGREPGFARSFLNIAACLHAHVMPSMLCRCCGLDRVQDAQAIQSISHRPLTRASRTPPATCRIALRAPEQTA